MWSLNLAGSIWAKENVLSFQKSSKPWPGNVGGVWSHSPKGWGFNSRSGHTRGLWMWPLSVCVGGSWCMFLSHIGVSLSLSLPLSGISKHIIGWWFLKSQTAEAGAAHRIECWPVNRRIQFHSQSGHVCGLHPKSLVGGMQGTTYLCVSCTWMFLSHLFLPPFFSINK